MYNKNTNKDLLTSALIATLGAGIVTSFAVSQGQHPLMALLVTAIAATFAVLCNSNGII